jgi:thiol-disulfide isomerase/thioredoxin
MMKPVFFIVFLFAAGAVFGQKPETIRLDKLKSLIESPSEEIYVINFWATWCAPCIKELPLFEKLHGEKKPGISIFLVSMDLDLDPNPEKVYKFVERKKIQSTVLLLNEQDPNSWIDKIDAKWSGALPATLVINRKTGQRKFVEKELHEGDLEKMIAELQ